MSLAMPVGDDISVLADWTEIRVAADGEDMQVPRLNRFLRVEGSEMADEEFAEDVDAEGDEIEVRFDLDDAIEAEVDVRVELILQEISDRATTGPKIYPFQVTADRVSQRDVCGSHIYLLLLVLGNEELPFRAERRAHEVEETFDHIALAALKRFLGRNAQGVRFARTATQEPADAADPLLRPTGFADAIVWLRDLLGLGPGPGGTPVLDDEIPHWETSDENDSAPTGRTPLSSYNDAGVDVVVWWHFKDTRAGFPVLLAQCTVQKSWERKVDDIKVVLWEKWIDFDTVPPQKALVIPFADRRDNRQWPDRTAQAGVILDRVRLLELLDELECDELAPLVSEAAQSWTEAELAAA